MAKSKKDPAKIARIISSYLNDSRDSPKRLERIERSITNNAAFNGQWDYSNKVDGQSCEGLPKVTTAVESFAAFVKLGLSKFGEWYRVEMEPDPLLTSQDVGSILKEFLRDMPDGESGTKNIEQVVSDGAKVGALDSLVIFKVHGTRRQVDTPPDLPKRKLSPWRLSIDVTPFEDYYPDPSGRGLYQIHEKQVDLFQVKKLAKAGVYDSEQVESLSSSSSAVVVAESSKDALDRDDSNLKLSRPTVAIREFYGTLVDSDGTVIGENMYATVANDKFLIAEEKPIPFWCGSPFATGPLTRVPHTVWHRAVMDYVSDLNQSLNDLYNLIFDAGISSVHGVKEVRLDWLEDPGSIAGGIAPQQTIALNSTAPAGASAITVAATGKLPGEVLALYQAVEREILEAAMTNEMRVGSIPQKEVLATEIISSNQNTAVLLDSVVGEYEHVLSVALTKAWQLIVQNADNLEAKTVIRAIGPEKAMEFSRLSAEERYSRYVRGTSVIVTGISSIAQNARELGKLIATVATIRADPVLMQQYTTRIDGSKLFDKMFALAGVDLRDIELQAESTGQVSPEGQQAQNGLPAGGQNTSIPAGANATGLPAATQAPQIPQIPEVFQ